MWAYGRYIALGAVALLFGASLLVFNLHNEYVALGGEVPPEETPTFISAEARVNLVLPKQWRAEYGEHLEWPAFLLNQLDRIGKMSVPFALYNEHLRLEAGTDLTSLATSRKRALIGLCVLGVCVLTLCRLRHKVLQAALVSSGFCWALPLRNSVFIHDTEAIYYVGVPMVFYAGLLLYLQRRLGNRVAAVCAGVALIVFVSSSFWGVRLHRNTAEAELQAAMIADFDAIRRIVPKDLSVVSPSYILFSLTRTYDGSAITFFLANRVVNLIGEHAFAKARESADFIVTTRRAVNDGHLLTPDNRMVFLHRRSEESGRGVHSGYGKRVIHSRRHDVYLDGKRLTYVSASCTGGEPDAGFFLHVFPVDVADLPEHYKQDGFENLDFHDWPDMWKGRKCMTATGLPDYDIARIRTGQYIPGKGRIWEEEFRLDE